MFPCSGVLRLPLYKATYSTDGFIHHLLSIQVSTAQIFTLKTFSKFRKMNQLSLLCISFALAASVYGGPQRVGRQGWGTPSPTPGWGTTSGWGSGWEPSGIVNAPEVYIPHF